MLMHITIALFIFPFTINGATYYSRNSANWNVNSTWSTAGYGGAAATSFPGANDTAKIGNTYTVTVNTNSSCAQLDIGQGTSGAVQYSGASAYTLTVGGNVTVNAGASLNYNTNNTKTHVLQIGGNLTNNGIVDLYYDANDIVNLTFNTSTNTIVSGSGTWALNNVTINKGSSTVSVDVQSNGFETAINTLTGTTGNYIHNNSGSYSVNSSGASDFAINQNMVFTIPQGTMWFSPNSNRTYLYGSMYITGGTVYVGSTSGNNGLRYDQIGTNIPLLDISSGTLNVYGGISYASGASTNPFAFHMTGGTILLNNGTGGTDVECFFVNDVSGSSFYMSAGTIIMQDHNSSPGNNDVDWGICGTNGSVTSLGGTVQFGNASTPSGTKFDFDPHANAVQPNFKVTGTTAASVTLMTAKSSTDDFKLLSLYIDTNKTFDVQSIQGVPGNSKTMTLTGTYNGVNAWYSRGTFVAESGTVTFGGTEAQSVGGTVSATFYNLIISNPAGVTLQLNENVSSLLTMTDGLLNTTSTCIITCTSSADATMGSASSFVNGPMIQTVATGSLTTRNFPLGKGTAYRPAILSADHSNNTSVTYKGEMFNIPAASLNYALPASINKISYTRYWDFTRQNISNLDNAWMTLYYSLDDSVTDKNRVVVAHDDGSARWVDYGGTGSANFTGNITSQSITSFKTKFALGFPPSPLPVELISFTAKKENDFVKCEWQTASEINSDYFTLERSADGILFEPIATLKAAGHSTVIKSYSSIDENPLKGNSYYRLRQTDTDGKISYSQTEHIFTGGDAQYSFYPNPSSGIVHIRCPDYNMENFKLNVADAKGQNVRVSFSVSPDHQEITLEIDPAALQRNKFFVLSLSTDEQTIKMKVIIAGR